MIIVKKKTYLKLKMNKNKGLKSLKNLKEYYLGCYSKIYFLLRPNVKFTLNIQSFIKILSVVSK